MNKQTAYEKKYIFRDSVSPQEIAALRGMLGMTQREFAELVNVSKPTVERWEMQGKPVTGPIVPLIEILRREPEIRSSLLAPERESPLRLLYYCGDTLCTIIDVDEPKQQVHIRNYTRDLLKRAFGINENPSYEQYEEFLESRCFPHSRDKIKIHLKELDIPFYDPLLIIQKTEGRITDDDCWIKVETDL